jgi:tetratricopeptide (TPR) repeat protein
MRQQGQLREALDLARKMVSDADRRQAGAAPLPLALHDYGVVSGDLSLYADAERALRRAIRLLEMDPPRDDSVIPVFRLRLAEVYLDAGRLKEAAALLVQLRGTWERTQPGSVELAVVLDNLAWIELLRNNPAAAEPLLQQSIRILEARTGLAPWRLGNILNDYSSMLFTLKRYEEAASYAERAQALFDREGVTPDTTVINTWVLLGAAYAYTGRLQEAEVYVRRSLSAAPAVFGEDSGRTGRLMTVAAAILRRCGQKAEAKSIRKKGDQMIAKADRENPGRFTIDVNALR